MMASASEAATSQYAAAIHPSLPSSSSSLTSTLPGSASSSQPQTTTDLAHRSTTSKEYPSTSKTGDGKAVHPLSDPMPASQSSEPATVASPEDIASHSAKRSSLAGPPEQTGKTLVQSPHKDVADTQSDLEPPQKASLHDKSPGSSTTTAASYPSLSGSFVPPPSQPTISLDPPPTLASAPRFRDDRDTAGQDSSAPVSEQKSKSDTTATEDLTHLRDSSPVTLPSRGEEASIPSSSSSAKFESYRDSSQASGLAVNEASAPSPSSSRPRSSLMRRPSTAHSSHRSSAERNRSSMVSSSSGLGQLRQSQSFESRLSIQRTASTSRPGSFTLAPLKIRDYAFPETDPRHVGARDVSHSTSFSGSRFALRDAGADQYGQEDDVDALGRRRNNSGDDWGPSASYDEDEEEFEGDQGERRSLGDVDNDDDATDRSGGVVAIDGLACGWYRVLYDFEAEEEHELSVKVGERVNVVGAVEGGWAVGFKENDDKEGLVPEGYLEWVGEA